MVFEWFGKTPVEICNEMCIPYSTVTVLLEIFKERLLSSLTS